MPKKPKKKNRAVKSEGAAALKRTGLTQQRIAQRLGLKGHTSVNRWLSGAFLPGPSMREKILAEFEIEPETWDAPPAAAPKAPKPAAHNAPPQGADVRARATQLTSMVDDFLASVDTSSDAEGKARLMSDCARTLVVLGKLTGETGDVSIPMILASPAWRRIVDIHIAVLEPWPDAARALGEALSQLE